MFEAKAYTTEESGVWHKGCPRVRNDWHTLLYADGWAYDRSLSRLNFDGGAGRGSRYVKPENCPWNWSEPFVINRVQKTADAVNQPAHYARCKMQPIEYIATNNLEWWEANVIKYMRRHDAKDGLKDLYKARSYLDMKIRHLEGHERFWEKPVSEERKLNIK
jgi:hypothetical protein